MFRGSCGLRLPAFANFGLGRDGGFRLAPVATSYRSGRCDPPVTLRAWPFRPPRGWRPTSWPSRLLLGDSRLLRYVADASSPDPETADYEIWRSYVRKNPVAGLDR